MSTTGFLCTCAEIARSTAPETGYCSVHGSYRVGFVAPAPGIGPPPVAESGTILWSCTTHPGVAQTACPACLQKTQAECKRLHKALLDAYGVLQHYGCTARGCGACAACHVREALAFPVRP